jgi:hypothetical protein
MRKGKWISDLDLTLKTAGVAINLTSGCDCMQAANEEIILLRLVSSENHG